jgi:carboxypeptidase Q
MPTRRSFLTHAAVTAAASTLVRGSTAQAPAPVSQPTAAWLARHVPAVRRLVDAATGSTAGWDRLAELCDTFGGRLTGSRNLALAIEWAADTMRQDGFDPVTLQRVQAPHWTRGDAQLEIVAPVPSPLVVLALGGSIGTPPGGITAPLAIVRSFEELHRRADEMRGRIVLFDVPYAGYGQTVVYRTTGAVQAARVGAVAALVRSVGPIGLRTPHTGSTSYADGTPRIPGAAIPIEDANRLARMLARGQAVTLRLTMTSAMREDVTSANVIGELRGREVPDEVVLVGGHFDSWDPAGGASDDGVGCIVTWEAVRLMIAAGLRPRRTVRVVLFTNEENGLRGALGYRDAYASTAVDHVLAIESDSGVFDPMQIGFTGSASARQVMEDIGVLLRPLGFPAIGRGGGGADIGPIAQVGQVPMLALMGDADRYFQIHHTPADTVERIDPAEVARATAAVATIAWIVADMPERLPR